MKTLIWSLGGLVVVIGLVVALGSPRSGRPITDASGNELTSGGLEGSEVFAGTDFVSARELMEQGDYVAAEAELSRLLLVTGRDGEACILMSEVMRELERPEEAVDYGLKAVELLPESAEAHLAHAQAIGAQMMAGGGGLAAIAKMAPRLKRMKEECRRVIELDPSDTEARTILAMTFLMLPRLMGGDTDRALELCREIEAIQPIEGKQLLALALNQTGDRQAAIVLCGEALEEFPEERAFYVTLGGLHAEDERFEEADLAYEAARTGERDEDYYLALYMQARMRIEGGFEPQRAIELLEEFILAEPTGEFVPSTASALWRQGVAHELAGEPDRARRCYGRSLELDPDFDKASEALGDLDEEGA